MSLDYDPLAHAYAQHRQVHPDVLAPLVHSGGIDAASRVLEVGCGTGNYIGALVAATGCRGWGIEPSPAMLDQARARVPAVTLRAGRAERLDYPDALFDLVFSVDVIHHVQDHAAYFYDAYRVLQPGGRVCTVTDSADIIRTRQPLAVYFPETVAVELARYPNLTLLEGLMRDAGFNTLQRATAAFAYPLTDLTPYQDKAYSSLHLIEDDAHAAGIRRMQQDLRAGPIPCVARYVLLWGVKQEG